MRKGECLVYLTLVWGKIPMTGSEVEKWTKVEERSEENVRDDQENKLRKGKGLV